MIVSRIELLMRLVGSSASKHLAPSRNSSALGLFGHLFLMSTIPILSGCITSPSRDSTQDTRVTAHSIKSVSLSDGKTLWLTDLEGNLKVFYLTERQLQSVSIEPHRAVVIFFLNNQIGWLVSKDGSILHTDNGGAKWEVIGQAGGGASIGLSRQMLFLEEEIGWIVDSFSVHLSEDGGRSWSSKFSSEQSDLKAEPLSIYSTGPDTAFVGMSNGIILRTVDRGTSWDVMRLPDKRDATSIFFLDSQHGWVGSWSGGGIYETSNGGQSWRHIYPDTTDQSISVSSLFFADRLRGWASGRRYLRTKFDSSSPQGTVVKTIDGGRTWIEERFESDNVVSQLLVHNSMVIGAVGATSIFLTTQDGQWLPEKKLFQNNN